MFRWEGQSERETGEKRPAETDSNRYLNGKIVEEVSRKERWRQKRKQSGEVERVTHPSVKSTDTLPHCPSLSLPLSVQGRLHLGPTLAAPAIPSFPSKGCCHISDARKDWLCMPRCPSHRPQTDFSKRARACLIAMMSPLSLTLSARMLHNDAVAMV